MKNNQAHFLLQCTGRRAEYFLPVIYETSKTSILLLLLVYFEGIMPILVVKYFQERPSEFGMKVVMRVLHGLLIAHNNNCKATGVGRKQ